LIGKRDGVEYVSGDPGGLIAVLRQKPGKDIWLCGGGDLACQLLERKVVDEISLSIIPILLGDGIPLFQKGYSQDDLQHGHCKQYETGVVGVTYTVNAGATKSTSRKEPGKRLRRYSTGKKR
jgi:dihydrofolate reductase